MRLVTNSAIARTSSLHRAREEGLTAQYILAGWRRSGLYPLDARKVLGKLEVARYRATTPDLTNPWSRLTLTSLFRGLESA